MRRFKDVGWMLVRLVLSTAVSFFPAESLPVEAMLEEEIDMHSRAGDPLEIEVEIDP